MTMTETSTERPAQAMPVSRGWPLLGAVPHLLRGKLDFLRRERDRLGDIYRLDLGVSSLVILNHPRHVDHMLRQNARNYVKQGPLWRSIRSLVGDGLSTAEGEPWRRKRRLIQPQFTHDRFADLARLMQASVEESLQRWGVYADQGGEVDLSRELSRLSMRVVVHALFGTAFSEHEADQVSHEMEDILAHILQGVVTQALPGWVPVPGRKRYQSAVRHIEQIVGDVIARRQREGGAHADLMSNLIASLAQGHHEPMSHRELRDEAMTLFLTGHETTAQMMSWAVHVSMTRPEIRAGVEREVEAQLGGEPAQPSNLRRLRYTRNVLMEVLRLYAPVYWLARQAVGRDEIDGFAIVPGDTLVCLSHVLHHHPAFWPDPDAFIPERFDEEAASARPRLACVPFGAGQRQCIGEDFALMEGVLTLARLVQLYDFQPVPGRNTTRHVSTTQRPRGGVWATLRRRQQPPDARSGGAPRQECPARGAGSAPDGASRPGQL